MIYRHEFFVLDEDSQIIYNTKDKEVSISWEMFSLLLELCKKKILKELEARKILKIEQRYSGERLSKYVKKINHISGGRDFVIIEEPKDEFEEERKLILRGAVLEV